MAKVKNNLVLHGLSGMLGRQVVIRRAKNGQYVVSAAPRRRSSPLSEAQKAHIELFRRAIVYARGASAVPEYETAAAARGLTSRNVAIADFLHPPEIKALDLSGYHGDRGQPVVVIATDDVKVKSVRVRISAEDGTSIEQGAAIVSDSDATHWTYTTTKKTNATSLQISADASDLAEHVTTLARALELTA
jgi:hypothetical protein